MGSFARLLPVKRAADLKKKDIELAEAENMNKMLSYTQKRMKQTGKIPYYMYRQKYMAGNLENTGYAKDGKQCVYNIDIMEETADNLAVGSNAVSKKVYTAQNRIERFASQKDLKTYLENLI